MALGDERPPEQREGQKTQHDELRSAAHHERHAQRTRKIKQLGPAMGAAEHPEIRPQTENANASMIGNE